MIDALASRNGNEALGFAVGAASDIAHCIHRFPHRTIMNCYCSSGLEVCETARPLTASMAALSCQRLVLPDVSTGDDIPSDRRAKELHLTKSGETRVQAGIKAWSQAQARFETKFGSKRAAELRAMLRAVAATEFPPASHIPRLKDKAV